MLHTGFHQRIWAARDSAAVRQGACLASATTFLFMLFFGFMGMVTPTLNPNPNPNPNPNVYSVIDDLLKMATGDKKKKA